MIVTSFFVFRIVVGPAVSAEVTFAHVQIFDAESGDNGCSQKHFPFWQNKNRRVPVGSPAKRRIPWRTHSGTIKRTRISQRMSQHIMLLKFTRSIDFLRKNTFPY
jgi:hypothetical protein